MPVFPEKLLVSSVADISQWVKNTIFGNGQRKTTPILFKT